MWKTGENKSPFRSISCNTQNVNTYYYLLFRGKSVSGSRKLKIMPTSSSQIFLQISEAKVPPIFSHIGGEKNPPSMDAFSFGKGGFGSKSLRQNVTKMTKNSNGGQ